MSGPEIGAWSWLVGGCFVALVVARWLAVEEHKHPDLEEPHTNTTIGFVFFVTWMLAPLAAAIGLGVGASWLVGRVLRPQDASAKPTEGAS